MEKLHDVKIDRETVERLIRLRKRAIQLNEGEITVIDTETVKRSVKIYWREGDTCRSDTPVILFVDETKFDEKLLQHKKAIDEEIGMMVDEAWGIAEDLGIEDQDAFAQALFLQESEKTEELDGVFQILKHYLLSDVISQLGYNLSVDGNSDVQLGCK